jgi:hypothetical protein
MFNNREEAKVHKFDKWMDIKAEPFGGAKEAISGDKGNPKNWQRVVKRDANVEGGKLNPNFDSFWRAMEKDVVSRQDKVKQEISDEREDYEKELGTEPGKAESSLEKFIKNQKESE